MPTKEQMDRVEREIDILLGGLNVYPIQTVEGQTVLFWDELVGDQRQDALAIVIDWTGFTAAQKESVIQRVIDGESFDFWMDGIEVGATPLEKAMAEVHAIKERENTRILGPTDIGLGEGWTSIGTIDLGKWADWSETQRLAVLEDFVQWEGVELAEKRRLLEREVDFSRVAPEDQRQILGEVWNQNDIAAVGRAQDDIAASAPESPSVRPLTKDLINAVLLDVWPKVPTIVDFGIDSERHLGALQYALKYGEVTPQEMDAAMGNGVKLTEIVQRGNNPYRDAVFKTAWDMMRLEPPDEPTEPEHVPLFSGKAPDPAPEKTTTLFGKALHGPSSLEPQKSVLEKGRDDDGREM